MKQTDQISYWNKAVETMPRDQLRELQLDRLKKMVQYVYVSSPFHRRNFEAVGVHPDDIRSLDDIEKLPFTTKEAYNESQQEHPPYGDLLCVPKEKLVRYWTTTGTTMRSRVFGTTLQDYYNYLETAARVLGGAGVRPGWRVAVFFPHGHWIGLWGVYDAPWMKMGAQIIPVGGYNTEYRVGKVAELGIDCIVGTPTYMAHISEVARQKGFDPTSVGVKAICIAGEPSSPSTRKTIEDTWGAKTFDFHGTTENLQYLGVDCEYQQGFHCWEDQLVSEIVDPDTGKRLPAGETGELVYTNLVMEAMPAIRFRSGDITTLQTQPCPCGRTHTRMMYILGRTGDIVRLKGLNVYPRMCEEVIRSFSDLGSEFRILLTREATMDEVTFQVEPLPAFPKDKLPDLKNRMNNKSKEVLGLYPNKIEFLEFGTLEKYELKAKRVIDKRKDLFAR